MICDYCRSAEDLVKDGTLNATSPNTGVWRLGDQWVTAWPAPGGDFTRGFDTIDEVRTYLHNLCKGCTCQHRFTPEAAR